MTENRQEEVSKENSRRENKEAQYSAWKAKNPTASNNRKKAAREVNSYTSTTNDNYPPNLFDHI